MIYLLASFCFIFGYSLRVLLPASERAIPYLNNYIIYIALPALIIRSIPGLSFSLQTLFPILVPWVLTLLAFLCIRMLAVFFRWDKELSVALFILIALGNTAFIGVSVIDYIAGEQAAAVAVVYDQLGMFLILSTVAVITIAMAQESESRLGVGAILKKIISFPPFLALICALIIPQSWLVHLYGIFDLLSATIFPLAMCLVGLQFVFQLDRAYRMPMFIVVFMKMFLMPSLVLLVALQLGLDQNIVIATVLQSAMPPMVTGAILLMAANIHSKFVATALGGSTLIAGISIPMWYFALHALGYF